MGIPSQRYLSKKAETRGRSQKRQEKSYRKWGYFTKEEWAIAQKNPPESILPILGKEGQDVNVFRKEMGEEMQWEMATSQREDPLFVFHERPSDNGN